METSGMFHDSIVHYPYIFATDCKQKLFTNCCHKPRFPTSTVERRPPANHSLAATSSRSSRTEPQPTVPRSRLSTVDLTGHCNGHRIPRHSVDCEFGAFCRNESIGGGSIYKVGGLDAEPRRCQRDGGRSERRGQKPLSTFHLEVVNFVYFGDILTNLCFQVRQNFTDKNYGLSLRVR